MPRRQSSRTARALLVVQLGALPLAVGLGAQTPLGGSANAQAWYYPQGLGFSASPCFYSLPAPSLNPVFAGGSCRGDPGFAAAAYARRGVIGIYANSEGGLPFFPTTWAYASWSDIVSWSNPLVSSIVFSFAVNGQVSPANGNEASVGYTFSYGSPGQTTSGQYSYSFYDSPSPFQDVLWQIHAPVSGKTSLPFEYALGTMTTWASADFWQGTGLTALTFLDAQGNPLQGVSYDFAAGTELLGTQAAPVLSFAPEPGTLTLVGTALLGILGAARRRRRRPQGE